MSEERDFFSEGREAFLNGEPLSSCPTDIDEESQVEWEAGYIEAEEEML